MTRGCRTEVVAGDTGPVVRKEAETPDGRVALNRERERLDQARHPGVVEVVDHGDDHLVLAWAGGETLETWRAPLSQVAGLLAACAATIGDLHELGVVHGRLQARHVVVGPDGRPRLAGFGGAVPGTGEPTPAGDVAALGHLIEHLVGPGVELEPIPDRRWSRRRWSGYGRRSLQTLADHATDADPARRPTARALAAAIADAVPGCELPPPTAADGGPSATTATTATTAPDGLPLGWDSPLDPEDAPGLLFQTVDHVEPGPRFAHGGDDAGPTETSPADTPGGLEPEPEAEVEDVVESGVEAELGGVADDRAADGAEEEEEEEEEEEDGDGEDDGSGSAAPGQRHAPPTILGLRIERPAHDPPITIDRPAARQERPHRRSGLGDIRTAPRRRPRRAVAAAVGAAAVALVTAGAAATLGPAADEPATAPADPEAIDRAGPASISPPGTLPEGACPLVDGPALDVDGDGCRQPVDVDGTTIVAAGVSYRVGEPGDLAGVGDWNCDGRATPALVRPDTGEVFVFDGWASDAAPVTVSASYTVPGAERFAGPVATTCGPPVLELRSGEHHRPGAEDAAR